MFRLEVRLPSRRPWRRYLDRQVQVATSVGVWLALTVAVAVVLITNDLLVIF